MLTSLVRKQMRAQTMKTLTDRCTILREVHETDVYGGESGRMEVVASDVRCRLIRPGGSRSEGAVQQVGAIETMPEAYRLIVPDTVVMAANELVELGGRTYRVVRATDELTDEVFRSYVMVLRRGDGTA